MRSSRDFTDHMHRDNADTTHPPGTTITRSLWTRVLWLEAHLHGLSILEQVQAVRGGVCDHFGRLWARNETNFLDFSSPGFQEHPGAPPMQYALETTPGYFPDCLCRLMAFDGVPNVVHAAMRACA